MSRSPEHFDPCPHGSFFWPCSQKLQTSCKLSWRMLEDAWQVVGTEIYGAVEDLAASRLHDDSTSFQARLFYFIFSPKLLELWSPVDGIIGSQARNRVRQSAAPTHRLLKTSRPGLATQGSWTKTREQCKGKRAYFSNHLTRLRVGSCYSLVFQDLLLESARGWEGRVLLHAPGFLSCRRASNRSAGSSVMWWSFCLFARCNSLSFVHHATSRRVSMHEQI